MPCFDPVLMISPGVPCAIMPGAKAREPLMTPQRLTAEDLVPVFLRAEHPAAGLDAGIVHYDVDAPEAVPHRALEFRQVIDAGDVAGNGQQVGRLGAEHALATASAAGSSRAIAVGDADLEAQTGKADRRR